jgi:hypothetical protein
MVLASLSWSFSGCVKEGFDHRRELARIGDRVDVPARMTVQRCMG